MIHPAVCKKTSLVSLNRSNDHVYQKVFCHTLPRVARVFPPASAFAAMLALDAYTKKFRRFNGALRSMIELYLGPSILMIPQKVPKVWCSYVSSECKNDVDSCQNCKTGGFGELAGTEGFRRDPHISSASVTLCGQVLVLVLEQTFDMDTDTHSKRVIFLQIKPLKQHMHVTVKKVLPPTKSQPCHYQRQSNILYNNSLQFRCTSPRWYSFSPDQAIYLLKNWAFLSRTMAILKYEGQQDTQSVNMNKLILSTITRSLFKTGIVGEGYTEPNIINFYMYISHLNFLMLTSL